MNENETREECVEVDAQAEEHSHASASDGVEDGDAHVEGGDETGASASVGVDGQDNEDVDGEDVGAGGGGSVGVEAHVDAEGGGSVGEHGAEAHLDLSAGEGVDASVHEEEHIGKSKCAISSSVSIGPEIGVDGGAHATIYDGILSVGIKGDVAAGLGLKGDLDIDIDTRPIVRCANTAWDDTFGKL